jgi:hypothetical protein
MLIKYVNKETRELLLLSSQANYSYALALEQLKLHTLQKRRHHLDALFLTQVYRGSNICPSALDTGEALCYKPEGHGFESR